MTRALKTILIILLLGAIFFVFYKFGRNFETEDAEHAKLRQSTQMPAVVPAKSALTEEQKEQYLQDLAVAQRAAQASDYQDLQVIGEIARLKKLLGDTEGAADAWRLAASVSPASGYALTNLAIIYHHDLKDLAGAEHYYLAALINNPSDYNTIRNLYELYLSDLNDKVRAEGLLLQSIKENPGMADLYSLLGKFYEDGGFTDEAIKQYRKYLEYRPENEIIKIKLQELQAPPK